ncbi:MAG TPA: LamG domain-containing protein [Candidatus Saccharimonadia bacterium]|nr:LamG domain-containing protein [Candidatus Saccharimonadia bacterium]
MLKPKRHLGSIAAAALLLAPAVAMQLLPAAASADLLQSTHFRLDPNVADTFGGATGSASYQLTDAGGEGAVGSGASQSYKLTQGYVSQLAHSLSLSVLPGSTYAYWPLDTGTGTVAYDVGTTADDGTLVAAPSWTTGIVGQGVTLNGSSQYVSTATSVANPTTFTLEVWFKSTSSNGGELMGLGSAQTGSSATVDRVLYLDNAGHIVFGTKPSAFKTVATASTYTDGSWHHVAATLGATGLLLYVDGLRQGTDASTTTVANFSGYWRLGFDSLAGWPSAPTSNFLAGTIDEARVYTRALSDAEIKNDYTAGANALKGAFTLPNITPGQSQTYSADAVVRTDAAGYDLYMQALTPLTHTDTVTTIPNVSGTIASPAAWTEGTTKGIGFTLTAGTSLEGKWGTSPGYAYAGLPSTATVYHSRTGLTAGVPELTTIQYRADTTSSQKQGTYSATIVYTATVRP